MITDTTVVHIQATPEQFRQLDANCTVSEQLFAGTLLQHLSRKPPEEHEQAVMEWFRCVRQMAFANFIVSGIRVQDKTTDDKLDKLSTFLGRNYGVAPSPEQLVELRKIIV